MGCHLRTYTKQCLRSSYYSQMLRIFSPLHTFECCGQEVRMRVYLMQVYNDIVWQRVNLPHLQASSGATSQHAYCY